MKSIVDLCREPPDSEPELRERAEEFNRSVWLAVADDMYSATQGTPDYLNSIADAKAATDRMVERGCWLQVTSVGRGYECAITWISPEGDVPPYPQAIIKASTEELARSAACVLAAEAMNGGK